MRSRTLICALVLAIVGTATAGKFNRKVSPGDKAPAFAALPGTDGKKHSLADYAGKDFVVVVFTGNECPVATSYEKRLVNLTKKYASGDKSRVAVVALNVSVDEDERLDKMKVAAKEKGFNFPYLSDETQKIGRLFGATVTPEVFVLDKDRKIVYQGGIDDNLQVAKVKKKYLEDALDALLAGKPVPTAETRPTGCSIEYKAK
jgi:peroxiredoxin